MIKELMHDPIFLVFWNTKITKSPLNFNVERAFVHSSFYKFEWVMCGRGDKVFARCAKIHAPCAWRASPPISGRWNRTCVVAKRQPRRKSHAQAQRKDRHKGGAFFVVEVTRFELATSTSRTGANQRLLRTFNNFLCFSRVGERMLRASFTENFCLFFYIA